MATGEENMEGTSEIPKELPFEFLSKITNDFSDDRKLGGTQFGTLYKGVMEDGNVIAVKKLDDNAQLPTDQTFKNEVEKLMELDHENLVRLVGFCSEAQELVPSDEIYDIADITANLLCYEFFPNGNLDNYLFGTKATKDFHEPAISKAVGDFSATEQDTFKTTEDFSSAEQAAEGFSSAEPGTSKAAQDLTEPVTSKAVKDFSSAEQETNEAEDFPLAEPKIDWDSRFKIINGICRGLNFLHSLDTPIIHMDLRLENIWLGANMVPKIGNFGLSRLFDTEKTKMYTQRVVGKYGHMAPEYFFQGEISTQADIYSLGLLIMEISTGEKNYPDIKQPSGRKYIKKIRTGWTAEHIASKYSSLDAEHLHQIDTCIKTGLECVEVDRPNRPSIVKIVDKLNAI